MNELDWLVLAFLGRVVLSVVAGTLVVGAGFLASSFTDKHAHTFAGIGLLAGLVTMGVLSSWAGFDLGLYIVQSVRGSL